MAVAVEAVGARGRRGSKVESIAAGSVAAGETRWGRDVHQPLSLYKTSPGVPGGIPRKPSRSFARSSSMPSNPFTVR